MSFTLPELPYAYEALSPVMSRETLEYHHDKHHLAYVNNGNNALKGTEWEGMAARGDRQGLVWKERGRLQQRRPALQPHPFLEVDEAEWRRDRFPANSRRR